MLKHPLQLLLMQVSAFLPWCKVIELRKLFTASYLNHQLFLDRPALNAKGTLLYLSRLALPYLPYLPDHHIVCIIQMIPSCLRQVLVTALSVI